jgi:hypothetical protein
MLETDVLVLGAGAAGMFCAIEAARRGRRVTVLDHAAAPGEKIRISGGGRCNFTNLDTGPERFLSANPRFSVSALSRFTARDFVARIDAAGIAWHAKALGQLFCDGPATQVVAMLVRQMADAGAALHLGVTVGGITRDGGFRVETSMGMWKAGRLVVATGGKSIPKMGATGLGYDIAARFGLPVTETRPALVPLTFANEMRESFAELSGVALPARVSCRGAAFDDGLLFTHRGLSGPSILQISSYWREGDALSVDLAPGVDVVARLKAVRDGAGKTGLRRALGEILPDRVAAMWIGRAVPDGPMAGRSNADIARIASGLSDWRIKPVGSEGYRTAEVTLGGVETAALESRTMEARAVPGLYFIGEVVDVTGWLGGYNFQWAWSSGWAAGQAV